jgi:hypothetical protein
MSSILPARIVSALLFSIAIISAPAGCRAQEPSLRACTRRPVVADPAAQ